MSTRTKIIRTLQLRARLVFTATDPLGSRGAVGRTLVLRPGPRPAAVG